MASKPPASAAKGAAAGAAAMLAVATGFVAGWEGLRTDPYRDSVGVLTVCIGETNVPMRSYTEAECHQMFGESFMRYANEVKRLSPGIEESPFEWAAHSSLTYNIGSGAYSRSTVRRLFNEGRRVEACRAFSMWNKAGGRELRGLTYRRNGEGKRIGERELCLAGAVPVDLEKAK